MWSPSGEITNVSFQQRGQRPTPSVPQALPQHSQQHAGIPLTVFTPTLHQHITLYYLNGQTCSKPNVHIQGHGANGGKPCVSRLGRNPPSCQRGTVIEGVVKQNGPLPGRRMACSHLRIA